MRFLNLKQISKLIRTNSFYSSYKNKSTTSAEYCLDSVRQVSLKIKEIFQSQNTSDLFSVTESMIMKILYVLFYYNTLLDLVRLPSEVLMLKSLVLPNKYLKKI